MIHPHKRDGSCSYLTENAARGGLFEPVGEAVEEILDELVQCSPEIFPPCSGDAVIAGQAGVATAEITRIGCAVGRIKVIVVGTALRGARNGGPGRPGRHASFLDVGWLGTRRAGDPRFFGGLGRPRGLRSARDARFYRLGDRGFGRGRAGLRGGLLRRYFGGDLRIGSRRGIGGRRMGGCIGRRGWLRGGARGHGWLRRSCGSRRRIRLRRVRRPRRSSARRRVRHRGCRRRDGSRRRRDGGCCWGHRSRRRGHGGRRWGNGGCRRGHRSCRRRDGSVGARGSWRDGGVRACGSRG